MKTRNPTSGLVLTRRRFLVLGGTAAAVFALAPLTGCGGGSSHSNSRAEGLYVYRLSSRGKRASNAAKKHNANRLFATWEAANANRAHPGDRSRIVRVAISQARYDRLFANTGREMVDLRQV